MHALSFFISFSIVVLWLMPYFLFVCLPYELASFSVWLSLSMCWSALSSLYALLLLLYYCSYFDFAPFHSLFISSNMLSFACSCSIFDSIAMFSIHQYTVLRNLCFFVSHILLQWSFHYFLSFAFCFPYLWLLHFLSSRFLSRSVSRSDASPCPGFYNHCWCFLLLLFAKFSVLLLKPS